MTTHARDISAVIGYLSILIIFASVFLPALV